MSLVSQFCTNFGAANYLIKSYVSHVCVRGDINIIYMLCNNKQLIRDSEFTIVVRTFGAIKKLTTKTY